MGLKDLLDYFGKYGVAGVIIAVLLFAVGALYLQLLKNLKEANARADRFEAEVRALNDDIQKYFLLGITTRKVMGEATDEMRRLQ
jgi:uncharacterized membrane protein YkvI